MFRSREPRPVRVESTVADGDLDLGDVGRALWARKLWLLLPAILMAALTFVVVDRMEPRYRSESRILIEGRENVFMRPAAEQGSDRDRAVIDQEAMNSQVQLVLSREVGTRVIEELKLKELSEFDPVLDGIGPMRQVLVLLGLARDPLLASPEERVFESYYDKLRAYQIDRSRVIVVEFTSTDPDVAARAANAVAAAYLDLTNNVRQDQTRAAGQWLLREIESLRPRVAEAESAVEQFRSRSNLFVGSNNSSLSNQQLGEVNSQITIARAQQADADAKAQAIRGMLRSGRAIETNEVINSELIRRLNEQRVTLRSQLAEQSSTLLDGHPRIKELRAQIADLERAIRGEAERLVRSLENDAQIAGARVTQLTQSLDQLKQQASSTNEQDVQLRALEREAKAQRDLLESYLAKYREATARDNLGPGAADARIISRAAISSTPYFPRKLTMIAIAFLGTLMIGAVFVVTGVLLGARPRQAEALVVTDAPALVPPDPSDQFGRHDFLADASAERMPPVLRAVPPPEERSLAAALVALRRQPGRAVVVGLAPGSRPAEAAAALAGTLAQDAKAIVVHLAGEADAPARSGLGELLARRISFGDAIGRAADSRAHVIEAGRDVPALAAVLGAERFAVTAKALDRAYRHVILNAGATPDAEASEIAALAPIAVLVAAPDNLPAAETTRADLIAAGCREVVIMTREMAEPLEVAV